MDHPKLAELDRVTRNFGGVSAVDDVSLVIRPGEILGLIGPNGAGKTTLVNLITGYVRLKSGTIVLEGRRIDGMAPHRIAARGIARTFQTIRLYRQLSVLHNVLSGMHTRRRHDTLAQLGLLPIFRRGDAQRVDEARGLLERVGLPPDQFAKQRAGTLSYGDQRRLEIARALALRPRLLLLDEPAAGMNVSEKQRMRELIEQLNADGLTILLIDHDMRLVMGVCERIAVLNFGRKLADGTPDAVSGDPAVVTAYLGTRAEAEGASTAPGAAGPELAEVTEPATGASTEPATGASTEPATGASTEPVAGASTEPAESASTKPVAGASTEPAAGSPTGPVAGSSTQPIARPAAAEPAQSFLEVAELSVSYGAVRAVRDASFAVGKGEVVALIGGNGAGKSTILNTLSGLLRPSGGYAIFDGLDLGTARPDRIVRHGLVQVPEGREVLGRQTVLENLALGAFTRRDPAAARREIAELLDRFPILGERRNLNAGQLSGGEQQILAIARGLLGSPRLLLLDEPSLGLAPQMVDTVFDVIQQIQAEGATILLVEQNALRALEIADRAYVIETGHILLSGTGGELRGNPEVRKAYLGG